MTEVTIENVRSGAFKRRPNSKKTYDSVKYCKTNRKYESTELTDINDFIYLKKGTVVYLLSDEEYDREIEKLY